jgi:hypothetical protein
MQELSVNGHRFTGSTRYGGFFYCCPQTTVTEAKAQRRAEGQ